MPMYGFIVWYYYESGVLKNSSLTKFEGTEEQFQNRLRENYEENLECARKGNATVTVMHTFIKL